MPVITAECVFKTVGKLQIACSVHMAAAAFGPVAVHIHGGALIGGDRKGLPAFEIRQLRQAGFSVVSVDYRLAPETPLEQIIRDIEDALAWVRGEGARVFGWDPGRVGVFGGSAGGYLTLMTGTFAHKPKALVSLYGYGDILGDWYCRPDAFYLRQHTVSKADAFSLVGQKERTKGWRGNFYLYSRQTGTWPSLVSGWDQSKERERFLPYCPALAAAKGYPPTLLLHGTADTDVPFEQSVQMQKALQALGTEARLVALEGWPHAFDYQKPVGKAVRGVFGDAVRFLKERV